MEEFVYYNNLFDIYSDLLTDNEKSNFKDYYQEDLSLSEIADNNNISKSAVGKMVKTVLEKLDYYEKILKIYYKSQKIKEILEKEKNKELKERIEKILND